MHSAGVSAAADEICGPSAPLVVGSDLWVQNERLSPDPFLKVAFQVVKAEPPAVPQLPGIYLGCKLAQHPWQVKSPSSLVFKARES